MSRAEGSSVEAHALGFYTLLAVSLVVAILARVSLWFLTMCIQSIRYPGLSFKISFYSDLVFASCTEYSIH